MVEGVILVTKRSCSREQGAVIDHWGQFASLGQHLRVKRKRRDDVGAHRGDVLLVHNTAQAAACLRAHL